MSIAQSFHKAEASRMSAFCFKLFCLSCSVLTFKSLKAEMHLLSWNHLLFICVIGTFWVQTKATTESLLDRPGTGSPLFRCQSCYSEMCSIRLLMVLHKAHCPDKNWGTVMDISWSSFSSWSFLLPLQEARSVGASVVSPLDIQKVIIFTYFCLGFLFFFWSVFLSVPFPFCCSWLINKRSSSINNCGELDCTPFMRMFKLFWKPVWVQTVWQQSSCAPLSLCCNNNIHWHDTNCHVLHGLLLWCTSGNIEILKLSADYKVFLCSSICCNYRGFWLVL